MEHISIGRPTYVLAIRLFAVGTCAPFWLVVVHCSSTVNAVNRRYSLDICVVDSMTNAASLASHYLLLSSLSLTAICICKYLRICFYSMLCLLFHIFVLRPGARNKDELSTSIEC